MNVRLASIVGLLFVGTAGADVVIMRDGSLRYGTVVSHDASSVRLRLERDGMTSVAAIPVPQISRVILGVQAPPRAGLPEAAAAPATRAASAPATLPATAPAILAATEPAPATMATTAAAPPEPGVAATEPGPDELALLPAAERELWARAIKADKEGKRAETLAALRSLEAATRDVPESLAQLDTIARKQRAEDFGVWMGRVHWELMATRYSTGQFELDDVRAVEVPTLIGKLRQATAPALEPLRRFFPPVDEKTGLPGAFRASQLQGIDVTNALEIKDKALYAAAVLLAQLKLEPEMPGIDRAQLSGQLTQVNRVLGRARDLEPQARAAQLRAEQEKKAAAELARRSAAVEAQRAATRPK